MTGTKGPYGYKFFLSEKNWLSLASWNHVHASGPEKEPSENVEIGLYNGELTCWRLDCKDVGELLVIWGRGNFVETVEYLEQHGELIS